MAYDFTVEQIEKDTMTTQVDLMMAKKNRERAGALLSTITIEGLNVFCERTLFLIDEIKRLKKENENG